MTRGWAKSLSFNMGFVFIAFFVIFSIECASASDMAASPTTLSVDFTFDQPKVSAHYSKTAAFTIYNTASDSNKTISGTVSSVSGDICITPNPSSFSIPAGGSKSITLTIEASPSAPEGTHTEKVIINSDEGTEEVKVSVTITYCAKIAVSSSSIDFGRVGRKESSSMTV